jgi:hypothetical protein
MGAFGMVLLVLAAVLYVGTLAAAFDLNAGDAAGNGLAYVWAVFLSIGLWVVLAALMILAAAKGLLPRWTHWAALVLTPACAAGCLGAIELAAHRLKWPLSIPVLAPLLVAAALRWPAAWAPAAVLAVLPWITPKPKPRAYQAPPVVEEQRELPRTQAALEDLLRHGMTYVVRDLPELSLEATPVVCEGVRKAIRDLIKDMRPDPANGVAPYFTRASPVLEYQQGLQWAVEHGCACRAELDELKSVVMQYRETAEREKFLAFLATL